MTNSEDRLAEAAYHFEVALWAFVEVAGLDIIVFVNQRNFILFAAHAGSALHAKGSFVGHCLSPILCGGIKDAPRDLCVFFLF